MWPECQRGYGTRRQSLSQRSCLGRATLCWQVTHRDSSAIAGVSFTGHPMMRYLVAYASLGVFFTWFLVMAGFVYCGPHKITSEDEDEKMAEILSTSEINAQNIF